jgi:hypothetical protein
MLAATVPGDITRSSELFVACKYGAMLAGFFPPEEGFDDEKHGPVNPFGPLSAIRSSISDHGAPRCTNVVTRSGGSAGTACP